MDKETAQMIAIVGIYAAWLIGSIYFLWAAKTEIEAIKWGVSAILAMMSLKK